MNTLGHSLCPSRCFMRGQGAGGDLRRLGEVRPWQWLLLDGTHTAPHPRPWTPPPSASLHGGPQDANAAVKRQEAQGERSRISEAMGRPGAPPTPANPWPDPQHCAAMGSGRLWAFLLYCDWGTVASKERPGVGHGALAAWLAGSVSEDCLVFTFLRFCACEAHGGVPPPPPPTRPVSACGCGAVGCLGAEGVQGGRSPGHWGRRRAG